MVVMFPNSVEKYVRMLQEKIQELEMAPTQGSATQAIIATICGRYYTMDRDNNWDRTEKRTA